MSSTRQRIEFVNTDAIQPHPDNPRQGDVGSICESIAANGWWGAVIVSKRADDTLVILAGEHRWRALTELQADGYTPDGGETIPYEQLNGVPPAGKVPIIVLEGLTLNSERKILLADNRSNDLASYDDARLSEILVELANDDDLFGSLFDGDALDQILADLSYGAADPSSNGGPGGGPGNELAVRSIIIVLSHEEHDEARALLDRARQRLGTESESATALAIWRLWERALPE